RMMSGLTGTITTVSTGWCTTRGHNMKSRWSKVAIFTTRWAAGWQNGCGGVNGT
ncbi:rhsB element core RshB domain protein, partial [Escherichia coli]|nr:rhsB element core RshB domain protein [Escherichia coli]EFB8472886.1 rhsB element core RshB domain protein [Escherichia coli]